MKLVMNLTNGSIWLENKKTETWNQKHKTHLNFPAMEYVFVTEETEIQVTTCALYIVGVWHSVKRNNG